MKRLLVSASIACVIAAGGSASAKGMIVRIGISGGGIPGEISIAVTDQDLGLTWGAAPRVPRGGPVYRLTVYMRLLTTPPLIREAGVYRYYPATADQPARLLDGDGADPNGWISLTRSLTRRLDAAIALGLSGTSATNKSSPIPWTAGIADAAMLVAVVALTRRGRFRSGRLPAPGSLA